MMTVIPRTDSPLKRFAVKSLAQLNPLRHIPELYVAIVGHSLIVEILVFIQPHLRHAVEISDDTESKSVYVHVCGCDDDDQND